MIWIGAALAVTTLLAGCSSDSSDSAATTDSTAAPQNEVGTTMTTSPPAAEVNVASNALGQILADSKGMTLYVFLNDTAGASTCVDPCSSAWPPLVATAVTVGSGLTAASFTLVARPDGTQQIAAAGRPLYRFAGDTKTGETTGQGLNSVWYVAGVDGQPIGAPAGAAG